MITKEELQVISNLQKVPLATIEKDYVIGWVLGALYQISEVSDNWVFKGGTSLRKCYFENYRFSEDLDFTLESAITIDEIHNIIRNMINWIQDNVGIEIDKNRTWFEVLNSTPKQQIIQGAIYYKGPASPLYKQSWPRIKFDITADEVLVDDISEKKLVYLYRDQINLKDCIINSYSLLEILAEKMRALVERTRPRDLYDVVELLERNNLEISKSKKFHSILEKKFAFKNIKAEFDNIIFDECKLHWDSLLSHQIANLENFEVYLDKFNKIRL